MINRLTGIDSEAERIELPHPDTSTVAWAAGSLFFGFGFLVGLIALVAAILRGGIGYGCLGISFVTLFGGFFYYVQRRSLDDLVVDFGERGFVTPDLTVPFDDIGTLRLRPVLRDFGRSSYWTWEGELVAETRAQWGLGTRRFEEFYPLLRRLAREADADLQVEGAVGVGGGRFRTTAREVPPIDTLPEPSARMDVDTVSGVDASLGWTYQKIPFFQVILGVLVVWAVIGGGLLARPRQVLEFFAIPDLPVGLGMLALVPVGLCVGLAMAWRSSKPLSLGRHTLARRADHIRHQSKFRPSTEWAVDDVDVVVRMEATPWTGVMVAGDGVVEKLPCSGELADELMARAAALHG